MGIFKKGTLWLMAVLLCFMFALPAASEIPNARLYVKDWTDSVDVVADDPAADQENGCTCVDSAGNLIVAWIMGGDVYLQKIDSDGSREWGDDGVKALAVEADFEALSVACCGAEVVVAARTADNNVYLQKLSSDGTLNWGILTPKVDGLSLGVNDADGTPQAVCDGDGGVVVAYLDDEDTNDNKDYIKVRRVDLSTGSFSYDLKTVLETTTADADFVNFGIVAGNPGIAWIVAAMNGSTSWLARAIGKTGTTYPDIAESPRILCDEDNGGTEADEFFVLSDGQGGVIAVGSYNTGGDTYRIAMNGVKASGDLWSSDGPVQLSDNANLSAANCQAYGATFVEGEGSDYIALLWSEDAGDNMTLQKFEIISGANFGGEKWTPHFDVDDAEVSNGAGGTVSLNTDDEGGTALIADLGGGKVGITWEEGEDLYALVVADNAAGTAGLCLSNDTDVPLVIGAAAGDTIVNTGLNAGSAYATVQFDPKGDPKKRYRVNKFSTERLPDLRWTTDLDYYTTDGLDTDEATSTLTVDTGVIKNAGQADATDVMVSFYLMRDDDGKITNDEWTAAGAVKIKVGEVNIGNLGVGEEYDFSDPGKSYDIVITQAELHAALQELGTGFTEGTDEYYLIGFVNEGEVIDEGGANGYYEVSNQNADKNIEACLIDAGDIHAPDLVPSAIDEDMPDAPVTAGDTVTLDEVEIENTGDRDATSVSFYLWDRTAAGDDPNDLADLKEKGILLKKVEDISVPANDTVKLDPVDLTIPLDTATGEHYVIYAVPDAQEEIGEFDGTYAKEHEDDNLNTDQGTGRTDEFAVTGLPDLALTFFTVSPATRTVCVEPGGLVNIQWVVKNMGNTATPATEMRYYLSTDATYDAGDTELEPASYVHGLGPGDEEEDTVIRRIPYDTACGFWYVIGRVVPVADEITVDNNVMSQQIAVKMGIDIAYTDGALSLTLDPCGYVGTNADWWLVAVTPFGTYWYNGVTWVADYVTPGHQGPLLALTDYEVTLPTLPSGTYTFYFGVDLIPDGSVTYESLCFDSVTVIVP